MKELLFSASKKDFKISTFCTGGPGGQNQNRKEMGVRITHISTGLSSECRELRSQGQNLKRAFRKLCEKLILMVTTQLRAGQELKISDEVIRTYHEPDNRVKDHLSGEQRSYKEVIDAGNESGLIDARRRKKLA